MKIGKYQILLGRYTWFQTKKPSIFRHFLFLTIVKEVDLTSTTVKKKYSLGSEIYHKGMTYRYYRKG